MTAAATPHRHRTLLPYAAALVAVATLGACTGGDPGTSTRLPGKHHHVGGAHDDDNPLGPRPTTSVDPVIAKIPTDARRTTKPASQPSLASISPNSIGHSGQAIARFSPNSLDEVHYLHRLC